MGDRRILSCHYCNAEATKILYVDDRYLPEDIVACEKHAKPAACISWVNIDKIRKIEELPQRVREALQ